MVLAIILSIWGCIPEITKNCEDMTNSSSTYLGIIAGVAIGAIISWWIYNRQKKTSDKQDAVLNRVKELEERHDRLLKKLEKIDQRHEATLNQMLELDKTLRDAISRNENQRRHEAG
jgi:ferric-dicitrate binding protein FerR (iron transport regulator)